MVPNTEVLTGSPSPPGVVSGLSTRPTSSVVGVTEVLRSTRWHLGRGRGTHIPGCNVPSYGRGRRCTSPQGVTTTSSRNTSSGPTASLVCRPGPARSLGGGSRPGPPCAGAGLVSFPVTPPQLRGGRRVSASGPVRCRGRGGSRTRRSSTLVSSRPPSRGSPSSTTPF